MASAFFVQSDPTGSPPTAAGHCSGLGTRASSVASDMDNGAGTASHIFVVPNNNVKYAFINWVAVPGVGDAEPSLLPKAWVVNWHVAFGSSLVKLGGVWICHQDGAGAAIETIASYNPSSGAAMTTGNHTHTFNSVNPTSWKAADKVVYVIAFKVPFGFGSVQIRVKYDLQCTYVAATQDFRGVTLGGGYPDRKREGVL